MKESWIKWVRWFFDRLIVWVFACPLIAAPSMENPAQPSELRIVTLAPHLTEMVFDLGLGESVVGVSRFSNLPHEAKSLPRVGDAYQLSLETIVALKPTHILVWHGGVPRAIRTLEQLGLPVYFMRSEGLSDIANAYRRLGAVLGYSDRAERVAEAFDHRLKRLEVRRELASPRRVFLQIQDMQLFTVNAQHFMGQALEVCGAENVFADARLEVGTVSLEAVIDRQPEVIVLVKDESQNDAWSDRWRAMLPRARIHVIKAEDLSQPVARLLSGISVLCDAVSVGAASTEVL